MAHPIAALATPPGKSAIALIRISGHALQNNLFPCFRFKKPLPRFKPRFAHHGIFLDPDSDEQIDDVIVTFFPLPNSYTGEDIVEISCHGSDAIIRRILKTLQKRHIRLAQAGEFTRRAFENGKIDLMQAEAIAQLIASESDNEARLAMRMLQGGLQLSLHKLRNRLIDLLAVIEFDLDFPEESESLNDLQASEILEDSILQTQELLSQNEMAQTLKAGLRVVLAGDVNVGKSTIFNRLAGTNKAIVTDEPGTTRDTLENVLDFQGLTLVIVDTAGIRDSDSKAEGEAIKRSVLEIESANLVLFVSDAKEWEATDLSKYNLKPGTECWLILNKMDIQQSESPAKTALKTHSINEVFQISAKTGTGFEVLLQSLREYAALRLNDLPSTTLLNLRQRDSLKKIELQLQSCKSILSEFDYRECAVPGIRNALAEIDIILGQKTPQDVLDKIFSTFCIGK